MASALTDPALCASAFPRLHPRPDYGPAAPVLTAFVVRALQLPLLYALLSAALAPAYAAVHAAFGSSALARRGPASSDDLWFTAGLSFTVGASYVLGNGFFFVLERRELLQRYRMYRTPAMAPAPALVRKTLLKEATSHLLIGPLLMAFVVGPGLRAVGSRVAPAELPHWTTAWWQFTAQLLINESMFYVGHRVLHTRPLYMAIHKQHHSYIGTRSFAGEYAHMAEDVLTAYIPFLSGLCMTRAHFHLIFVWFFIRVLGVTEGHSGYCFKGTLWDKLGLANADASASHDFHHTHNRGNFGNVFYDWLFGTMDAYVAIDGERGYLRMADAQRAAGGKLPPR